MALKLFEYLNLKKDTANNRLVVYSDINSNNETFYNKDALKKAGFKYDGKYWYIPIDDLQNATTVLNNINKTIQSKSKNPTERKDVVDKLENIEDLVTSSNDGTMPRSDKDELLGKIEQYISDIANATDERAANAELQRFYNFMGKFHHYSFTNTFLIYIQRPTATKVAGFRQWKDKFHRYVKEGAKGIYIIRPQEYKRTVGGDEDTAGEQDVDAAITNQRVIRGITYKKAIVFDIADTEPIDEKGIIPDKPKWKGEYDDNEKAEIVYDIASKTLAKNGIKLTMDTADKGEGGYSAGGHINISAGAKGSGAASTIIHEWAHELVHHRNSPMKDERIEKLMQDGKITYGQLKQIREIQAETVSAAVCQYFDLPVEHHPTYLALWKADSKSIKENVHLISKVSSYMVKELLANADL